jgi:hypothetical protein
MSAPRVCLRATNESVPNSGSLPIWLAAQPPWESVRGTPPHDEPPVAQPVGGTEPPTYQHLQGTRRTARCNFREYETTHP